MELSFWKEVISEEEKTCRLTYVYTYTIGQTARIPQVYEGYRVVQVDDEVWKKLMAAKELILPSGLSQVGTYSTGTPKLQTLHIDDLHWYLTAGGPHHNISGFSIYDLLLNGAPVQDVVYPRDITQVMPWQFYGCATLERVELHDGITQIGTLAFSRTALQSVVIPGSVRRICSGAFRSCKSLERVEIREGVEQMDGCFSFCSRLREVFLPSTLLKMACDFSDCSPELVIHIPSRGAFDRIEFESEDTKKHILAHAVFDA